VSKKNNNNGNVIAVNRRASFEYFIEQRFEAGISLQGWEIKAIRAGKCNISEAYVNVKGGEVVLFGAIINPLKTTCAFVISDPTRTRKLLLNRREIDKMAGAVQRQGYTVIPLKMYFKGRWAKLEIGIAKGKQAHDKRDSIKDREWARDKERIMKKNFR
jgi:SsrA-binding protein